MKPSSNACLVFESEIQKQPESICKADAEQSTEKVIENPILAATLKDRTENGNWSPIQVHFKVEDEKDDIHKVPIFCDNIKSQHILNHMETLLTPKQLHRRSSVIYREVNET